MSVLDFDGLKIESNSPQIQSNNSEKILKDIAKRKLSIVFCLPGSNFSHHFLNSMIQTIIFCYAAGIKFLISNRQSSVVHFARALCLGANVLNGIHQKPFDGKLDYTHFMWIDSDMVWSVDQFIQLLSHDTDIVSGLYSQMDRETFVSVKDWDVEHFKKNGTFQFMTRKSIENQTNLMSVSYTGMGFMLIKKGVFESLEYPWFVSLEQTIDENIKDIAGEDASLCLNLIKKGYKIYVDPKIIVGHEKRMVVF
ncbi:MAG: hypothetical protein Q7R33_01775 [Nitrosarchaeum sp.]|nr:hypothetical protein [Nitrosarchaeum sp.]